MALLTSFRCGLNAISILVACLCVALPGTAAADPEPQSGTTGMPQGPALVREMKGQDAALFDAFNHCSDPKQLDAHAALFAEDVEFYHDNGGVTWTRDAMIENTRKNACGKYTRQLLEATFDVSPIAGYGALTRGTHRFCTAAGRCEGEADFLMVWRYQDGLWKVTRAFSFGHRASS